MKRRNAIKGIILFSLGTGVIFSCRDKYQAIRELNLNHLKPKNLELDLIETISNIILPLSTIPALKNHTPLPFMFTMIDHVYSKEDRDKFILGMETFDSEIKINEGILFSKMKLQEQTAYLKKINEEESVSNPILKSFYDVVKKETIRYLTTSEYYQRKANYYEMAPGRFNGGVLISELTNANEV